MVVARTTPEMGQVAHDFSKNPMLVYWEMTQACGLACKHCRAEAMPGSHPLELTTEESKTFIRQLLDFGDPLPHLILTGGDPLRRKDIYQLIDYVRSLGLPVSDDNVADAIALYLALMAERRHARIRTAKAA